MPPWITSLLREDTPLPMPLVCSATMTSCPFSAAARATARPTTPAPTTRICMIDELLSCLRPVDAGHTPFQEVPRSTRGVYSGAAREVHGAAWAEAPHRVRQSVIVG